MKKTLYLIMGIVWLAVAVVLGSFLVQGLNGSLPWNFAKYHVSNSWNWTSAADMIGSRTDVIDYEFDADLIDEIEGIMVPDAVHIEIGSGSKITVKYRTNLNEDYRLRISTKRNTLCIDRDDAFSKNFKGNVFSEVTIKVPASKKFSSVSLTSVSGGINAENISADYLDLNSVSGSLSASNVNSGNIRCETVSGSVNLEGNIGKTNCNTVSGSIKVENQGKFTGDCEFGSISGSVKISLDEDSAYKLIYSTVSGSVKDEIIDSKFSKSGSVTNKGNGKDKMISLRVETVSGSIKILKN